jgi:hypothetical protein
VYDRLSLGVVSDEPLNTAVGDGTGWYGAQVQAPPSGHASTGVCLLYDGSAWHGPSVMGSIGNLLVEHGTAVVVINSSPVYLTRKGVKMLRLLLTWSAGQPLASRNGLA